MYVFITELLLKEGNVLFNDALNTFYLQLYGVRELLLSFTSNVYV